MNYSDLFRADLVELRGNYPSKEVCFERIGEELVLKGFVTNEFLKAIKEREMKYPTGLHLEAMNIAIPHTDVEYVKSPFVYICKLNSPLSFIQMGTNDVKVEVETVMILGIKEPKEQVGMLSGLMSVFNNKDFIEKLRKAGDKNEVVNLFQHQIQLVKP